MQHRRSIFSRTSWKVSAEHRDRKDVSGPTVRAKNQSMKQKQKSVWTVGTDDGTNQKIMFHYSERSIEHVDWYYVFMMTWKMWAQWGLIETTGLKRKSEGVDNQAVSPSHDSWSSSSEVPHWAAAFRILCADWILTDWNSATAGAMRRGGDASLCVLFRSNLLTLAIQYFN